MIIATILSLIFFMLSGIHFYWLFGGKWALKNVIPTKIGDTSTFTIPSIATGLVAIFLFLFGFFYLLKLGVVEFTLPERIISFISWMIPIIFLLRAIGEFKYVGFFKSVKTTEFGKWDTILFSPLCLAIGVSGITLNLII